MFACLDFSRKLSGEVDPCGGGKAKFFESTIKFFSCQSPGDLGDTDIGGVDDNISGCQSIKHFIVADGVACTDFEFTSFGIEPGLRCDLMMTQGDRECNGFHDRAWLIEKLAKLGIETIDIFLTNMIRVIAPGACQCNDLAGVTLHHACNNLLGMGELLHLV